MAQPSKIRIRKRVFVRWGIVLGIITVLLRVVASPEWIERYYARGLYPLGRVVWDTLVTSWFPVALVYLLLAVVLVRGLRAVYQWIKLPNGLSRLVSLGWGLLGLTGWVVGSFLLLWGFNYGRVDVEDKLGLDLASGNSVAVAELVQTQAVELAQLRAAIPNVDSSRALMVSDFPADYETNLRDGLEATLSYYNYPTVGAVRARLLYPQGVLLRISTAGVYLPWVGEGHVDAGLLHLQRPSVMAHEMAHGYGFGDEGSCSFWAYLSSYRQTEPVLIYTLRLGYWRSLAAGWRRADPEAYAEFRVGLPPGIIADMDAINENNLRYPDLLPRVRDAAYDAYLKSQGIAEGLQNYGKVVQLVETWRPYGGAFRAGG